MRQQKKCRSDLAASQAAHRNLEQEILDLPQRIAGFETDMRIERKGGASRDKPLKSAKLGSDKWLVVFIAVHESDKKQ